MKALFARRSSRRGWVGVATVLMAAGLAVGTATAASAAPNQPAGHHEGNGHHETSGLGTNAQASRFQAQARANGLSPEQAQSLQAKVDRVIARTGGTQVAINQVNWKGGDTLIPLPGEARARELGATPAGTVYGCDYYQFCTYAGEDYTGMVDRMSSCTWHSTPDMFRSYVNNQTAGTRAKFYDADKIFLSNTKPAFAKGTTSLGNITFYIVPC